MDEEVKILLEQRKTCVDRLAGLNFGYTYALGVRQEMTAQITKIDTMIALLTPSK